LKVHDVHMGKNTRKSYSRIKEVLEMPNLIEIQSKSYEWFLREGLKEVFDYVNPITDYTGNLKLEFVDYSVDVDHPKYPVTECKERDATYCAPLRVKVRLTSMADQDNIEIKESDIFMGDFYMMTEQGTFIVNGAERVVVSQLVRSPGVYFSEEYDKTGKKLFSSQVIPYRGAWLEYETDSNDVFSVRIDRTRKVPVTVLIRALGCSSDQMIRDLFGDDPRLNATIEKDVTHSKEEALLEIYKRLRPGEPPTLDSAQTLVNNLLFDPKRYDLYKVGRYKFNKKLALHLRITDKIAAEDIISANTGEVLVQKGELINRDKAMEVENSGTNEVFLDIEGQSVKVFSNAMVDPTKFVDFDLTDLELGEKVNYVILKDILSEYVDEEDIKQEMKDRIDELSPRCIIIDDILASINYMNNLQYGIGEIDDIDHLGNRRLRSVGELLQNQFRIGLARMERVVRERMTVQDVDVVTPQALINIRPVVATIKEFFGSSQLSQFMDQPNPLAELTHKRRLSALGPGGLSRDRASFDVRDVHHSHYGRMCPIETPEGANIGLINSLATFAKVNEYGFIESPYRRVVKGEGVVTDEIVYLTADEEDEFIVAQANSILDENNRFVNKKVAARYRDEVLEVDTKQISFMDVSPKQVVSVATAMIPFLENDDSSRALMGANMQRQAVPLLITDSPIVATGMEYRSAKDSGVVVKTKIDGIIEKVASDEIIVRGNDGTREKHKLLKFLRSNQGTCINQRPIVEKGEAVSAGDVIADGPATDKGEMALGKNILIGFMTWEGYNYEDAVLISERLVREDVYTSIHIEEYESESRDTKLGPEEITRDIPHVGDDSLRDLDENGIIRIGAEVTAGDILVGKVTPKGETELTAEERLLRAIFGEKAREVRDTSLRVPHGESGIIVDVKIFTRENGDELPPGVNKLVRCYIAQKRKISVGDKMAGRHGNKGVISRILPEEDLPFLPDGTPLQIVLNPLGVPSRMNIGQVLEVHLGYAAKALGWKIETPVFDGATEEDIEETLKMAGLAPDGKSTLYDGRTGDPFDNRVTVGYMYYMKLSHLVDDKIHARSTGPYSLVTQQPLGGKAQFGGQRFGEMEVWALEAYGAAYTLQEILTVKSDDVVGRVKTYEAIVRGENIPRPGAPEAFKVLIKELQSLALDIKVIGKDEEEIDVNADDDEEVPKADLNINIAGQEDSMIPVGEDEPIEQSGFYEVTEDDDLDIESDSTPSLDGDFLGDIELDDFVPKDDDDLLDLDIDLDGIDDTDLEK